MRYRPRAMLERLAGLATAGAGADSSERSPAPQLWQKDPSAGFGVPQLGQGISLPRVAPQLPQKRAGSGLGCWQEGQSFIARGSMPPPYSSAFQHPLPHQDRGTQEVACRARRCASLAGIALVEAGEPRSPITRGRKGREATRAVRRSRT